VAIHCISLPSLSSAMRLTTRDLSGRRLSKPLRYSTARGCDSLGWLAPTLAINWLTFFSPSSNSPTIRNRTRVDSNPSHLAARSKSRS